MPSPRGARSLLGRVPVVGSSSSIVRLPPRSLLRTKTCFEMNAAHVVLVLAQYSFDSSKKKIKHWKAAVHWIQSAARSRRPSELGALRVFLHSFQLAGRGRVARSDQQQLRVSHHSILETSFKPTEVATFFYWCTPLPHNASHTTFFFIAAKQLTRKKQNRKLRARNCNKIIRLCRFINFSYSSQ